MLKRRIAKGTALLVAVALIPLTALGCDCVPPDVPQAFENADAVFSGKVERITYPEGRASTSAEPRIIVQIAVSKVWKGGKVQTINLDTVSNAASCSGYWFEEGREYLVYAYRQENGSLNTNICSRTALLERAHGDIGILDALAVIPGTEESPETVHIAVATETNDSIRIRLIEVLKSLIQLLNQLILQRD